MTDLDIVLLKGKIDTNSLNDKSHINAKIYALDNVAHTSLEQNSVQHEIADENLTDEDLNAIFDKVVSLYNWYDAIPNRAEFEIDGVNCFGILDTQEFQSFFTSFLYDFLIIKKIIEKDLPKKIITNQSLKKIISLFSDRHDFDYEIIESDQVESMVYESIEIKSNFGKIPVSFSLSRNNYLKLKKLFEKIVCGVYGLWPDPYIKRNSVLLLEMNPVDYDILIKEMKDDRTQVLLLNNRRPAIWNRKSIETIRNNDCKIIDMNKILHHNERKEIEIITLQLKQKFLSLKNNESMEKLFAYEGVSFWHAVNDNLLKTVERRLEWYVFLLKGAKKILSIFNIKHILSLNVVGETEKSILLLNKQKIPSTMIEHAFANYAPEISRYDVLSMYSLFRDRIAVWGNIQKSYLISQHGIDEKRIIVSGSPRHDSFFTQKRKSNIREKIILITPRPIIDTALHKRIKSHQQYEMLLEKLLVYFDKKKDVKVIIKTHPGLDAHNIEIKRIIRKNNPNVPIYQNVSIKELIESAYAHVNISPEGFDLSTVVLESLSMDVPIMNIILDEKVYDFEINKMKAIINTFDSNFEEELDRLIFDENVRKLLIKNGQDFLHKYMSNMGNASEYLAREIKNYETYQ